MLVVKQVSRGQVPGLIGKYKNGRYRELQHVARYLKTDRVKITCDKPTPINLDGEIVNATVADCKISEHKVRFFYPRGLTY